MDQRLDNFLCRRFPKIFAQRNGDMKETCMCWGFSHGDGWARILYDLCLKLELLNKTFGLNVEAVQVKEKFGTLCFYVNMSINEGKLSKKEFDIVGDMAYDVIHAAEYSSGFTCENCGEHGKIYSGGWVVTRCPACATHEGRLDIDELEEKELP